MLANEGWDTPLLIFSLRCTSKTKSILEVQNIFKTFWLWMWEVDRVIFCPVVWSIPFSYGIGLPLLINSRFDWKSSYEKCFSLAIESSIFVVNVKYKKSNGRTSINPTGGLSRTPPSLWHRYWLPPLSAFSLLCGFMSDQQDYIGSTHTWNTWPILWIERTYNTSVHKYYSGDKQRESKRHALNCSEGLHNLRWGAARRCLTSHVSLFEQDMRKFSDFWL